jgi:hypothetical protein
MPPNAAKEQPMTVEGSRRAVQVACAANLLAAAAALGVLTVARSSVVVAAAVAALVCLSSAALMLLRIGPAAAGSKGTRATAAPADASFWSCVVALGLFSMGSGVAMLEGVERLKQMQPTAGAGEDPGVVMLALVGAMTVLALSAWLAANSREVRAAQDPVLLTVVVAQSAATISFAIALTCLALTELQGVRPADGAGAVAIGLMLAAAAAVLAVEIKRIIAADRSETGDAPFVAPSLAGLTLETISAEARPDTHSPPTPLQPADAKPQLHPRDTGGKPRGKRRR